MMRCHGINHFFGFTVATQEVRTDERMGSFDFVANRLADVVKQPATLGGGRIQSEFGCQQPGEVPDFDTMVEDVLGETVPEAKFAQKFGDLEVQRRQSRLVNSL